jgi:hypothetical protein
VISLFFMHVWTEYRAQKVSDTYMVKIELGYSGPSL